MKFSAALLLFAAFAVVLVLEVDGNLFKRSQLLKRSEESDESREKRAPLLKRSEESDESKEKRAALKRSDEDNDNASDDSLAEDIDTLVKNKTKTCIIFIPCSVYDLKE